MDFSSPSVAMPSSRPNLTLDERSFEGLLSAAFIIQEHNDRQKQARQARAEAQGESSGADEFRPGERLQRNWASMWLMSQERGLWPERSGEIREEKKSATKIITPARADGIHDPVRSGSVLAKAAAPNNWITEAEDDAGDFATQDLATEDSEPQDFATEEFAVPAGDDALPIEASAGASEADANPATAAPISFVQGIADWRVKLRFQRADLYLGTAIVVAALALLWPAAGSPQPAALSPWERALVTLGIAEAPAPVVHLQGDPGIEVWVDPHSALYYCPGEEQYGKTTGGRLSSQHDAQMDRFEPAGRSACE
ncbi:MAG TPA: hypothetical protein VJX69_04810 [Terriglobales bacterium]|nr:hypothetical protein [Terriglobales bacterium]